MEKEILTLSEIKTKTSPIISKYHIQALYLFGSYARGDATPESDLDFLVVGGEAFRPVMVLAVGEELREVFVCDVDVYEIREVEVGSELYRRIMREKVLVGSSEN